MALSFFMSFSIMIVNTILSFITDESALPMSLQASPLYPQTPLVRAMP